MLDSFKLCGHYEIDLVRAGKIIARDAIDNLVVTAAKAAVLNAIFNGTAMPTVWYIGLINHTPSPTIVAADTAASHALWSEYTGVNNASSATLRSVWTQTTPTSNLIGSSTPTTINFTSAGTVYGLFIISDSTVGGTSGTLFSAAAFSSPISVLSGDQMRVTYSLQI